MRLHAFLVAIMLAFSTVGSLAADPAGRFNVRGSNPGETSPSYNGTVEVTKTGDTYRVIWTIGGERFNGTGIGGGNMPLIVTYRSGNQTGVALIVDQNDREWVSIWAYAGGTTTGTEIWTRR